MQQNILNTTMFTVEVNLALPEIITSPPRLTPLKKMVKNQKKVMGTGQVPPPPLRGEGGYDQWEPLSDSLLPLGPNQQ